MKKFMTVFILIILSIFIQSGCKNISEKKPTISGYSLDTGKGSYIIIITDGYPDGFPVIMNNHSENENLFENVQTGDKIKITYDGEIMESYPGQTIVYDCEIIEKGNIENISQDIFDTLKEMGWIIR